MRYADKFDLGPKNLEVENLRKFLEYTEIFKNYFDYKTDWYSKCWQHIVTLGRNSK